MANVFQCNFRKDNARTTAWIAERGAKVGNVVEFKSGENRDPGWEVISVGGCMDEKDLHNFNRMHRAHRQGSDI